MPEPTEEYVITHAKGADGEDNPFVMFVSFGMTLGKMPESGKDFLMALFAIDGVEGSERMGRYSVSVGIAPTFDPAEVKAEVVKVVEAQSKAGLAKIITSDTKIITP